MIFVDTGGWFAAAVPSDPRHADVSQWLRINTLPLVTTELLTLMRARGERTRSLRAGELLLEQQIARLVHVTRRDVVRAWEIYKTWRDKNWSFTDCVSRVVMERLSIQTALSLDHHFHQFGTVTVVP